MLRLRMQSGNTVTNLPTAPTRVAGQLQTQSEWHATRDRLLAPIYNSPVEYSLRDFHNPDFETLWRIDQQCFAPGISYSQPELAAYIRLLGSFTLVAETSNSGEARILGFVVANRRRQGHIITIDVLPEARRLGIGSKLLSAAEDRLRASQCTAVKLETAVNNMSALAFYKRHGYFVVKTVPRYYPDGLDAFVLEKNLLSAPPGK
jgi:ribosomal-protein-alanine N-acetyltransferase